MASIPLGDIGFPFSEIVEGVISQQVRATITEHGKPVAVVISFAELESIDATLDALGGPDELRELLTGIDEADRGDTVPLSTILADLAARRRAG